MIPQYWIFYQFYIVYDIVIRLLPVCFDKAKGVNYIIIIKKTMYWFIIFLKFRLKMLLPLFRVHKEIPQLFSSLLPPFWGHAHNHVTCTYEIQKPGLRHMNRMILTTQQRLISCKDRLNFGENKFAVSKMSTDQVVHNQMIASIKKRVDYVIQTLSGVQKWIAPFVWSHGPGKAYMRMYFKRILLLIYLFL